MRKTPTTKAALSVGVASLVVALAAVAQSSTGTSGATGSKSGSETKSSSSSGKASGDMKSSSDSKSSSAGSDKSSGKSGSLAGFDHEFVMKAAQGGMTEVEMGKAAQQKAQHAQVKQFAERMVTDHTKSNDELKSVVSNKGLTLPSSPDKAHAQHTDKMQRLSGPEFDREYMKHMVDDHKKTVADFEKASKSAKDADVKGFASKTLPTLREHYKMAQDTYGAVKSGKGGSGAASSNSGSGSGSTAKSGSSGSSGKSGSGGAPGTGTSSATGGTGGSGSGAGSSGNVDAGRSTPGATGTGGRMPASQEPGGKSATTLPTGPDAKTSK